MSSQENSPVSVGEWMVTYLLMLLPLVNIIMLFVWAFGDSKPSKSNWAKANLIWMAIMVGLWLLIMLLMLVLFNAF